MSKLLGIDFGDKRVGLALGQSHSLALPYKIIINNGLPELANEIRQVIIDEEIDIVVVGWPVSLSGADNERIAATKQFITYLKGIIDIPIDTVDERLTSALYKKQGVKKDLDKHSAAAILETYISQHEH